MLGSPIVSPAILRVHREHCTHWPLVSHYLVRHVCINVKCMYIGLMKKPRVSPVTFFILYDGPKNVLVCTTIHVVAQCSPFHQFMHAVIVVPSNLAKFKVFNSAKVYLADDG